MLMGCGGGVAVDDEGKFFLSDGEITGNTAPVCGGVYFAPSATFNLRGGTISGNTAMSSRSCAGGV